MSTAIHIYKLMCLSLSSTGLQWQGESFHCYAGPHDQHCERLLADGLAGRQPRDCYDHETQGEK